MSVQDFLKKLKGAAKDFNEGKSGRTGGMIDVDKGEYIVRFQSMEVGVNDNKNPYAKVISIVVSCEHDEDAIGATIGDYFEIVDRSGKKKDGSGTWSIPRKQVFAELCKCLQTFGANTQSMEKIEEVIEAAEELEESQPAGRVKVIENKSGYLEAKWGKHVEKDDQLPAIDDVLEDEEDDVEDDIDDEEDDEEEDESDEEDDEDSEDEEDESDEDDDEDEEDEEEEEIEPPTKGAVVKAKPPKTKAATKYKVTSVNKSKQTCTLQRVADKKVFKDQSWEVIQA